MTDKDTSGDRSPWNYKIVIAALIALAFTFEMGSFIAYGLEFFPALSFFQHVILAVAAIPSVLLIVTIYFVMIALFNTTLNSAGRAFNLAANKSDKIGQAKPILMGFWGKLTRILIPLYMGFQWITATNALYFIFTFMVLVLSIMVFGPSKWRLSSESSVAKTQLIGVLAGLGFMMVAGLGNIYGDMRLSKSTPYDDEFCINNKCTQVRMIMTFETAALYADGEFVVYHPFDEKTEVRVKIPQKKSLLDIMIQKIGEPNAESAEAK